MGRYDKIRYWDGSAWVQPKQIKYWNGSAWVDLGANDSDNTTTLNYYNGSAWKRATLNKKVTNTSTLDYKWVRGQVNSNRGLSNWSCASSSSYGVFRRRFRGYMRVVYSGNCRIFGAWYGGLDNPGGGYFDDANLISTGYFRYRVGLSGTNYTGWSYQTMTRNAWHYVNFTSHGIYNSSSTTKYMRLSIDNGTVYNFRTANGGSSSQSLAKYASGNVWFRWGGTSTDYRGTIDLMGAYGTNTSSASVNIEDGTVGSKLSISAGGMTWTSSNNTIQGVYNNSSTTTWE